MHNKRIIAGLLSCMLFLPGTQLGAGSEDVSSIMGNIIKGSAVQWGITTGKWLTWSIVALMARDKISEYECLHKVPVFNRLLSKRALHINQLSTIDLNLLHNSQNLQLSQQVQQLEDNVGLAKLSQLSQRVEIAASTAEKCLERVERLEAQQGLKALLS